MTRRSAAEPDGRYLLSAPRPTREVLDDRTATMARRWSALAAEPSPALIGRLTTLLRRLAAVVGADPYDPVGARAIGVDLVATGFFGRADDRAGLLERGLPASLALLRADGPAAFGVSGLDGDAALAGALDELAAGFARAMTERDRVAATPVVAATRGAAQRDWFHRTAFEQAAVGIGLLSLDGTSLSGNRAIGRIFGVDLDTDTEPRPMADFVHPDDLPEVVRTYQRLVTGEAEVVRLDVRVLRPDATVVWVHIIGSMVCHDDGSPSHLMALVEDVSTRRWPAARVEHASSRDQLTRLPGQAQVDEWVHRAFHSEPGSASAVGVCAVGLDGFDATCDVIGPELADRLLLAVAGRLQMAAGDQLVARTSASGFTVLIADPETDAEPVRVADHLLDALSTPFVIDDRTVTVSASVGVAHGGTRGIAASSTEMMRAADIALSWAVAQGGGRRVVFDPKRDAREASRFVLLSGLRGAIGRGEFRLLYQPLVGLPDRRLRGAEALVRWEHPEEGLLGPSRFIELAEQSGAIVPLGRWVLETACAQAVEWWTELGPDAPYVSVNVSPVQMAEPGWVDEVHTVLATSGLPPELLQLEITEQAVLGDEAAAMESLAELAAVGVRLALDDFGTGYSSFAWLRRLPVHTLKIDGSFIDGLRHPAPDLVDRSIVRALIDMAHALRLEVTAEWVETVLQAKRLSALGCDTGQGRWFGDPGPGRFIPELLRRRMGH